MLAALQTLLGAVQSGAGSFVGSTQAGLGTLLGSAAGFVADVRFFITG